MKLVLLHLLICQLGSCIKGLILQSVDVVDLVDVVDSVDTAVDATVDVVEASVVEVSVEDWAKDVVLASIYNFLEVEHYNSWYVISC